MKRRLCLPLVVLTAGFLAACSGEEELHSGPACFEGQHQECKGGDENVRCKCVEDAVDAGDAGMASDGSDVCRPADMDATDGS